MKTTELAWREGEAWRTRDPAPLAFVVAVLEGIEGTLDEVITRVDDAKLRADLNTLRV